MYLWCTLWFDTISPGVDQLGWAWIASRRLYWAVKPPKPTHTIMDSHLMYEKHTATWILLSSSVAVCSLDQNSRKAFVTASLQSAGRNRATIKLRLSGCGLRAGKFTHHCTELLWRTAWRPAVPWHWAWLLLWEARRLCPPPPRDPSGPTRTSYVLSVHCSKFS